MNLYLKQRNNGSYLGVLTKIVNSLILFSVNHFIYRCSSRINGSSSVCCSLPLDKWVFFPQNFNRWKICLKALMLLTPLRKINFSEKVLEAPLPKEVSLETL